MIRQMNTVKTNLRKTGCALKKTSCAGLLSLSLVAILSLTSCQESKRDRIEREAREYTEKNCPRAELQDIIYLDSLVCHNDSNDNYVYYYSVKADSVMIEQMKAGYDDARKLLLKGIRNSIDLRYIKEERLNIIYAYYDAATHKKIQEYVFTPEEYE